MASKKTNKARGSFSDLCVVYYSKKDNCWIAHSLHTDQIGTGGSFLRAYMTLIVGIRSLVDYAKRNGEVCVHREAPHSIQKRAEKALPIPEEAYDYIKKTLAGRWPNEFELRLEPQGNRAVRAHITASLLNLAGGS